MTYGVDQCRVCGVTIKPHSPRDIDDWLEAQKRPPIPEKEWRRRGFLAAPTRHQMQNPAGGCCQACGERLMRNKYHPVFRLSMFVLAFAISFAIVWKVVTYSAHTGKLGTEHEMR
jgi:hypothetical protein